MLDIGANFSNKYGEKATCKIGCYSLQHLLECPKLTGSDLVAAGEKYEYGDLFSNKVEKPVISKALL